MSRHTVPAQKEKRRVARGLDRLFLRPPAPCAAVLDALKEKLGTTRSLAVAYAVQRLAKEVESMSPRELEAVKQATWALEECRVITMVGLEAIEYAETWGLQLCKYADAEEEARRDLSPSEAREIARIDPGLVFIQRTLVGDIL